MKPEPSSDPVVVRCIDLREHRAVALVAALAMGLATLAVGLHVVEPPHEHRFFWFGLCLSLWCYGLAFTWFRRSTVIRLRDVEHELRRVGVFSRRPSVSVARGARGYSIAVGAGAGEAPRGVFLEVERASDAQRVLERLGITWPGEGVVTVHSPHRFVRALRRFFAVCGGSSGLMYAIVVGLLDDSSFKSTVGLPALVFGLVASVVFILEPLLRRAIVVGRDRIFDASTVAQHVNLHFTQQVEASASPAEETSDSRVAMLARADDGTRAWLARLDALGAAGQGYRGDAFSADELQLVVRDAHAPADARLGALRVLARSTGASTERLREELAADLGAARVRIVAQGSAEEAAEALEDLGPAFRAQA